MNQYMSLIGKNARKASAEKISTKIKNKILKKYALLINREKHLILKENAKDINFAKPSLDSLFGIPCFHMLLHELLICNGF